MRENIYFGGKMKNVIAVMVMVFMVGICWGQHRYVVDLAPLDASGGIISAEDAEGITQLLMIALNRTNAVQIVQRDANSMRATEDEYNFQSDSIWSNTEKTARTEAVLNPVCSVIWKVNRLFGNVFLSGEVRDYFTGELLGSVTTTGKKIEDIPNYIDSFARDLVNAMSNKEQILTNFRGDKLEPNEETIIKQAVQTGYQKYPIEADGNFSFDITIMKRERSQQGQTLITVSITAALSKDGYTVFSKVFDGNGRNQFEAINIAVRKLNNDTAFFTDVQDASRR
jgi:hypothetical protein